MSENITDTSWLDIEGPPEKAGLPAVVSVPSDYRARLTLLESCWQRLTVRQRTFLNAWRDCRYNERAACRQIGLSENTKPSRAWMEQPDYATVVRVWRANAAPDALDRDKIVLRQEEIIEEALTPKPILHQGVPTGYEEVDLGVAARANEVLLDRVLPKPRADVEVNVGVAFTPVQVEVMKSAATIVDGAVEVVEADPVLP